MKRFKHILRAVSPLALGFAIGALICLMISLCGCSRRSYVPLQSSRIDSLMAEQQTQLAQLRQTVTEAATDRSVSKETIIRDSVIIVKNDIGDVVSREVVRVVENSTDSREIATLVQTKVDSILSAQLSRLEAVQRSAAEIPVPVEQELTAWQRVKQGWFGWVAAVCALLLIYVFRKPIIAIVRRFI